MLKVILQGCKHVYFQITQIQICCSVPFNSMLIHIVACAKLIRECSVLTSPIVTNGLTVHLVCVCTSRTMSLPYKVEPT